MQCDVDKLVMAIVVCHLAGFIGMLFTSPNLTPWYMGLVKPDFAPGGEIIGPVWLILYTLMGISLYLVWCSNHGTNGKKLKKRKFALNLFGLQLGLNAMWSIMFFGLQSPLAGLGTIIPLWVLILLTIIKFKDLSKTAAWLLVPYLIWVAFATFLNYTIWQLNPM